MAGAPVDALFSLWNGEIELVTHSLLSPLTIAVEHVYHLGIPVTYLQVLQAQCKVLTLVF